MKWNGESYLEGTKMKYKWGLKDYLTIGLIWVIAIGLIISGYFLNTYRWGC